MELRRLREISQIAFASARRNPALYRLNLGLSEPSLSFEMVVSRDGLPGWHAALSYSARDIRRVFFRILIGEERKRRHFARMMTFRTMPEEDGRDVFLENRVEYRCGKDLRRRRDARGSGQKQRRKE
jgi:hypothetical protein